MSTGGWTINVTGVGAQVGTGLQNNALASLDFALFESLTSITFGEDTFTVDEHTEKWAVRLTNWPFASTENSLTLTVRIETVDAPFDPSFSIDRSGNHAVYRLLTPRTSVCVSGYFLFPRVCVLFISYAYVLTLLIRSWLVSWMLPRLTGRLYR